MKEKVEEPKKEEKLPVLDANDVNILYTLVQQANIKVGDVQTISATLDKCVAILKSVNQKVNG
jgi:hypothetical protein